MNKLLVIIGPTASGKSELAVKLAKLFHGEIISADSRQIYKGMDLGTGKVPGKWKNINLSNKSHKSSPTYFYKSIPHHLIDFQNPARQYSASHFQITARKKINEIIKRGNLPIICGGTMHWVDAVVYNQTIPEVKPNFKLRAKLEKQSAEALFKRLLKLDPVRASNIDKFNKRRLIRALEIVITTGRPVPALPKSYKLIPKSFSALWLGMNVPQKTLNEKINLRLKQRIKQGMLDEVRKLHQSSPPQDLGRDKGRGRKGLSWQKLESFGLEYKFVSLFLQKKITKDELMTQLSFAIQHYSKRQMTWWKRNQEIVWIKPDIKKAEKLTAKFLKS